MKKRFRVLIAAALTFLASPALAGYPDKPVRIIVPYSPGGTSDFIARITAQNLSEVTGVTFIVENKTGAAGRIGYDMAAKAPGDGYTLVASDTSYAMLAGLYPKLPWAHETDLIPITVTAETPVVIVAGPNAPFASLKELVVFAKSNPGKLNYGSGGAGSSSHLAGELFKSVAGVDIAHIPFKGAGEATTGVISDTVEMVIAAPPTVISHIKSGKVKGIAVTSPSRSPALPDVPSVVEAGLPGFVMSNWFGLMAPKGTPDSVVAYLQQAVAKVLERPDVKERLTTVGAEAVGNSPSDAAKRLREDTKLWGGIVKSAGVTLE
jgi:tripartite-type tricarboxylate transporter receptor subunit TctC